MKDVNRHFLEGGVTIRLKKLGKLGSSALTLPMVISSQADTGVLMFFPFSFILK